MAKLNPISYCARRAYHGLSGNGFKKVDGACIGADVAIIAQVVFILNDGLNYFLKALHDSLSNVQVCTAF